MDRQLLDYFPQILKEFREVQAIAGTEQPEAEQMWDALQAVLNDQFVLDATENGVRRWEGILKIIPKATASLYDRRFLILARLSEELPYSLRMLMRQMESLCGKTGYTIQRKNKEYTLVVRIALTARSNYDDVNNMLQRMIPANMIIDLSLLYNQHKTLGSFTHRQLSAYTHNQLRNEVLVNGE